MPTATPAAVRARIASGTSDPIYVLLGDDAADKAAVASEFLGLVEEELQPFNVDRLHGGDIRVDDLFQAVATLPMMAPRRVVIVMDADRLLTPKREGKAAEEEQARLEAFVAQPPAHATVVFVCHAPDQRRRVVKRLLAEATVVNCGTVQDAADAERWVKTRAAKDRVPLDPAAVRALAQRAGVDLVRLRAGLERVALYAMGQPVITADDVRAAVPASAETAADFGIANAIARGDAATALRELELALDAGAQPYFLLGQLRVSAEKLPARRLAAAMDAVMETDVALKSSGGDQRILLERLTVELCGAGAPPRIRR
jgi:DNA polymerase-3 subunit delta